MLSDEEKKAIEYFKSNLEMTKEMGKKWGFQEEIKNNETILNLIEKQSKEIEKYKKQLDLDYVDKHFVPVERYNQLEKEIECLNVIHESYKEMVKENNYISKDKIKAKIEELEKEIITGAKKTDIIRRAIIYELQSLLEKE